MEKLDDGTIRTLQELVFEREYNKKHPDDYSNAGGFYAHWDLYTDEERRELINEAIKTQPTSRIHYKKNVKKILNWFNVEKERMWR